MPPLNPFPRLARRLLKRWLPRSLYGRSLLIIILPIVTMQAAVGWAFFEAHWRTVTRQLSESLAGDVAWDVDIYRADPRPAAVARLIDQAEKAQSLSIAFQPGRSLPSPRKPRLFPAFDQALRTAVDDRVVEPIWIDTHRYPAYVDIRVAVKGGVLRFLAPRERAFSTRGHVFLLWLTGATLLLTGIAVVFIRNQVRAIERLAAAADAFGRGADAPYFKPHGAREVRQAATAFLAMKSRIQRHIAQRTTMLAAISHDLRTPLTRLKLELAMAEPADARQAAQVVRIQADLAEMEHMIDEYLAFAAGQEAEPMEDVRLDDLMARITAATTQAAARAPEGLTVHARPGALKRALSNLVGNACAYAGRVEVEARVAGVGGVEIVVDDDGPGIAAENREAAFRPFNRLDEARNQNVDGVGLGLAIARDIVRGHGGDITLEESPLGGLRAVVRLPG